MQFHFLTNTTAWFKSKVQFSCQYTKITICIDLFLLDFCCWLLASTTICRFSAVCNRLLWCHMKDSLFFHHYRNDSVSLFVSVEHMNDWLFCSPSCHTNIQWFFNLIMSGLVTREAQVAYPHVVLPGQHFILIGWSG